MFAVRPALFRVRVTTGAPAYAIITAPCAPIAPRRPVTVDPAIAALHLLAPGTDATDSLSVNASTIFQGV